MLCRKKQSILFLAVNSETRTAKALEIRVFQVCRIIPIRWEIFGFVDM